MLSKTIYNLITQRQENTSTISYKYLVQCLHIRLLTHIFSFFFQASTDQSVLDMEMPQKLGWCAFSIIQILGTIAVMSQVAWEVFAIFIPVTAVCIWYQVSLFFFYSFFG